MTAGRLAVLAILLVALAVGVGIWYAQTRAYYEPERADVPIVLTTLEGEVAAPAEWVRSIDSASSPIRFRACFQLAAPVPAALPAPEPAEPTVAPGWFDCYDAGAIAADLEAGRAAAALGQANVTYGVDRLVALHPDGRGYAWHQINRCGAAAFDERPVPAGCPPPPES